MDIRFEIRESNFTQCEQDMSLQQLYVVDKSTERKFDETGGTSEDKDCDAKTALRQPTNKNRKTTEMLQTRV